MTEETKALTVVGSGALASAGPAQFVDIASRMAASLAGVVEKQKLYAMIQGKKYVTVEGWTTLASMLGVFPCEVSNEDIGGGVYVAVVELRKADGSVLGRASAECGGDEDRVWGDRDAYARRSMAATRATSKACRLSFSWIMTMAGYVATPAEEIPDEGVQERAPQRQSGPGPKCPDCQKTLYRSKFKKDGEKEPGWYCWKQKGGCGGQFPFNLKPAAADEPDIVDAEPVAEGLFP